MTTHEGSERGGTRTLPLVSGPKFHVNERVLVTDLLRDGASTHNLPPLHAATVRECGLKCVDPTTGLILLPMRKNGEGRVPDQNDDSMVKQWCHLIHYHGWSSRHDRWMCETEIFHDTPENRMRVVIENGKVVRTPRKSKEGKENNIKKRVSDNVGVGKLCESNLRMIRRACVLPFTLQTILVEDMERITNKVYPPQTFKMNYNSIEWESKGITMLHILPTKFSILDVMRKFIKICDTKENAKKDEIRRDPQEEATSNTDGKLPFTPYEKSCNSVYKCKKKKRKQFAHSITSLFDVSLPRFLLYKEERAQFAKVFEEGDCVIAKTEKVIEVKDNTDSIRKESPESKRPSEVYGAEHLLRFIIKLPFLMSQYDPKKSVSGIIPDINEGYPVTCYILASEDLSRDFASHLLELVVFLQTSLDFFEGKYTPLERM
jgi:hypothetical protein